MDQFQSLRAFQKVVEKGAFNRAAEALGMPTSTISKAVMDLEKHLKVKLLHRTTRKITITQEGMEYYERTHQLMSELQAIDADISGKKYAPSGHLRIDCQVSFATLQLIPALKDFQRQYPDITLGLGINDKTADLIDEGIDCVIRLGGQQIPGMVERKLLDLAFVTCASPSFIAQYGMPDSPRLLGKTHPTVAYFRTSSTNPMPLIYEQENEKVVVERANYTANNGRGILDMALNGLGIVQHERLFAEPYINQGKLVELFSDWQQRSMPLNIVYPPNRHQNARLQVFIDWMIETFRP